MESEAFALWTKIFNENVLQSQKTERKELKIISMLITALQFELRNVYQVLELAFADLNNKLTHKDNLNEKVSTPLNCQSNLPSCKTDIPPKDIELKSPDIFINESLKSKSLDISVIDLSISDEDIEKTENSPTLISKRKKIKSKKTHKLESIKKNVLNTIHDNSVVDCTPEVKKKSNTSKTKSIKSSWCSKKKNNTTLTQLFTDLSKTSSICEKKQEVPLTESTETSVNASKDKDTTEMSITQLLSFVNKDDTPKNIEDEMSSSQELDEFSKGILFDNSQEVEPTPKKKMKVQPTVEPVVRGHARKLLKGFSCAKCKEFYGSMNLSPEELQKKLDECSNHRYKYQPPDDTYPDLALYRVIASFRPINTKKTTNFRNEQWLSNAQRRHKTEVLLATDSWETRCCFCNNG